MSTFNGLVDEFPDIRIDHFRTHAGKRPPAACFLSHVHSDHLLGLETLKMPFVYCSAVTRNLLLRMEKYPHRINFQKGILESRRQTYRQLKSILRALPLEAPIELELKPHHNIRVTLLDANHCPGAVMFLIEGADRAILYTGDVRAESWWVNSIVRNPVLLPYTYGQKSLDCIYLDTTFATRNDIHEHFPSKADGLKELLQKVDKCPAEAIFYFRAWTLGYEDVWIALANHLQARVHVDDYQLRLYTSCGEDGVKQGASLVGTQVGNIIHPGCLSNDVAARVHSCEPGMDCYTNLKETSNLVWITPIISRSHDGTELTEMGAGGGLGDLQQVSRLELVDDASLEALRSFCSSLLLEKSEMHQIETAIKNSISSQTLDIRLDGLGLNQDDEVTLKDFVSLISRRNASLRGNASYKQREAAKQSTLRFPYSRHSSLSELRDLISRFRPKDVCPCTVESSSWSENVSMESLFGDLCSGKAFVHDAITRGIVASQRQTVDHDESNRKRKREPVDSHETASQDSQHADDGRPASIINNPTTKSDSTIVEKDADKTVVIIDDEDDDDDDENRSSVRSDTRNQNPAVENRSDISLSCRALDSQGSYEAVEAIPELLDGPEKLSARQNAYQAAKSCLLRDDPSEWDDLHLRSVGWKGHTEEEVIL